jgi:hypothetical protein
MTLTAAIRLTQVVVEPPWLCHMLVVLLAAFVLARLVRPRVLGIVLSCGMGLAAVWALGNVRFLPRVWFDAWVYWKKVLGLFRPGTIRSDPVEYLAVFFFCWVAPGLIAWWTVRVRTRGHPKDYSSSG